MALFILGQQGVRRYAPLATFRSIQPPSAAKSPSGPFGLDSLQVSRPLPATSTVRIRMTAETLLRRAKTRILWLAALGVVALSAAPARAQDMRVDMRVDRLEVIESG